MSSVRTANFCNNFADGNDEELLIAQCCRRHSFHGNLCVLNICFFYRAFNHLIIVSRCRFSWVLQRWETFNFQVGPDNTFIDQYLYPTRHSLDKNTHYWAVLSSESHVVQNATQNLVDRISRADAAPEQLMLRCLFFFSFFGGVSAKARECGSNVEWQRHYIWRPHPPDGFTGIGSKSGHHSDIFFFGLE